MTFKQVLTALWTASKLPSVDFKRNEPADALQAGRRPPGSPSLSEARMELRWKKAMRRLVTSGYPRGQLAWDALYATTGVSHRLFRRMRRAKTKLWAHVEAHR